MRYTAGDILMCYKKRQVYKYTGKESTIYSVLTTTEESNIFKSTGANTISFNEFKKISSNTDLRSKRRIYGTISIDENTYLHLRKLCKKYNIQFNFYHILNLLLNKQEQKIIDIEREKPREKRKTEILNLINKIKNNVEKL